MNGTERPARHPAEDEILAWLERQLRPASHAAIGLHIDACPVCAQTARELESDAVAVHRSLDAAAPPAVPDAYVSILRRRARRRARRATAAAAALVAVFAAGAAALATSSPANNWLARLIGREARPRADQPSAAPYLSVLAPQRVDVAIAAPADSLQIRVSLSSEPWLEVRTGAGETLDRVELDETRLTVVPGSARALGITLPARSHLRILIGGDTLLSHGGATGATGAREWTDTSILVLPGTAGGGP